MLKAMTQGLHAKIKIPNQGKEALCKMLMGSVKNLKDKWKNWLNGCREQRLKRKKIKRNPLAGM